MPVFSKSLFQSIVDRLEDEAPEPEAEPSFRLPGHGLRTGFVAGLADDATASDPHRHFDRADPEPEPAPKPPDWLDRLDEATIALELGLETANDIGSVLAARRRFARLYHPDRVAPEHRAEATIRMTTANRLVDERLRAFSRQAPLSGGR